MRTLLLACAAAVAAAQSVTVTPTSFKGSKTVSTVTWTFPKDKDGCFVATFSVPDKGTPKDIDASAIPPQPYPATSPWLATAPLHYLECNMNKSFSPSGEHADFTAQNNALDCRAVTLQGLRRPRPGPSE